MTITIVDLQIWLQVIGIRMSRERRCLVLWLRCREIKRLVVVLVLLEIFMEVLEHADLGQSGQCLQRFREGSVR
jgi:hypothetical protein